jgi:hypothetical protein
MRVAAALYEARAHLARGKEQLRALPRASGSRNRKPVVETSDVESDERVITNRSRHAREARVTRLGWTT